MCMLKQLFNSIFSKQTNQAHQNVPAFTITDNGPENNDFELAEMNFVEFAKLVHEEPRKTAGASQSK
jgi:hypothetical protein